MQKLAETCIRRPVFATMLILALVVVGAASWIQLPVDRFPSVDIPSIRVRTTLPGASPEEAEVQVTQRLEEAVNTIEGLNELRSISASGISMVLPTFELSRDIDAAAQDVRDRVASAIGDLPRDTLPPLIAKIENDSAPILSIAVSGDRTLRELTEIADKIVRRALERSSGVGEVTVVGGLQRAINIWVDANRLAAYKMPITDVRSALERQNANLPGGNVTSNKTEQTLRTLGRITDPKDFNDLVIKTVEGAPIRIRDIGWAEDGTKEQRSISVLNGVPTVTLEVRRQSGANTVEAIHAVKANMERVQALVPPDVRLEVIRDQSNYIDNALHEINLHLVLGSVFACLVVFLFMRNWRATVIAGVAIPASVISTFAVMRALDFTLNSVTMLALVLMVGIVIDDAIVVLENIFRYVEEKKLGAFEAATQATAEIALPVMATTFSLVVIFIPVSFMSSISGRFLYQFGFTAAAAILVSLLVSFTLTPMMSARTLSAHAHDPGGPDAVHGESRSRRGFYSYIDRFYTRLLEISMRRRATVVAIAVIVALSAIPLYGIVKQEYIPGDVDEAEFEVNVLSPEGTSVPAMTDAMTAVEREIRGVPGVRLVLWTIGSSPLGGVNQATCYVRIAPHEERVFSFTKLVSSIVHLRPFDAFRNNYSQRDVMQATRQKLRRFKDLRISIRNIQSFNIGGGNWEIDFVLRGPDLVQLSSYAEQLRARADQLGLIDADTTLKLDKPELQVRIDRARAANLNVDTENIAQALRLMVGGDEEVTRFRDAQVNDDYDVELRLAPDDRGDPETISRLYVPRGDGGLVRLDNLVQLNPVVSPSRVDRLDRQRQVSLRASIAPGYAQADRIAALREEVAKMNLPAGYTTTVAGRGRELERTGREFAWAFLLSVAFMYMILAAQFESLVHPFTILLSLPIAVPFGLLALWATGNTLNLYSALGMLVLFGVVKKNAILQIDHMNGLRRHGLARDVAIMQANRDRLRPILMTTLALVAGMLPLALGTGPGAEERRTIAVVVIGGQMMALGLTLLLTPVAYSLFDDLAEKAAARRAGLLSRWRPAPRT
jgi:hydrophobic/amphiphilic exporter-1 (mainly G- bacteria), HAE1 family